MASNSVLPSPEEAAQIALTPDSIVWRRASDARMFVGAGAALILQVAYPTVGAGVRDFSDFKADPWGRLMRTLDYLNLFIYGGPQAAIATGARLREMHKKIKGVASDGTRYHALEPEAYAWVHATLAESMVAANQLFARPMRPDQIERFWREWRSLGRLVGVRERDLPPDWVGFRDYVDEMVAGRLGDNETVQDVLVSFDEAPAPPLPLLSDRTWPLARTPVAHGMRLATKALLPPLLRERIGLRMSRADELQLRLIAPAARATTPLLPESLRSMGPSYLRWREKAIGRGTFAAALEHPSRERPAVAA